MTDAVQSLAECTVLVVDDDYYLAESTRQLLADMGAMVLGPYGSEADVLACLIHTIPNYAILDLNLGFGPNFGVAREMTALGIPAILVTGYDESIIPPDLGDLPCLQKPVTRSMLATAIINLVRRQP